MHVTEWQEPALLWNGSVGEVGQPRLLEIRSDDFMTVFLDAMASPDPAAFFQRHQIDAAADSAQPLKLFQPLHGCYYLVTASLVCRQVGLPDKEIVRADDETVSFVVRRQMPTGEEAWIQGDEDGGYWQALSADEVLTTVVGEERFPLNPVTICPKPETPQSVFTDFLERDLHYGYLVTGNRKKYQDTTARTTSAATPPQDQVNAFIERAEAEAQQSEPNFTFQGDVLGSRVIDLWHRLETLGSFSANAPTTEAEQQLYLLLELGDFLRNNLPTLWTALVANDDEGLPSHMATLFETLEVDSEVERNVPATPISLRAALVELEPYFELVRGVGEAPADSYNILALNTLTSTQLESETLAALTQETAPMQLPGGEASELLRLVNHQVRPRSADGREALYVIRAVYEYDPDCPPVVSILPSHPFSLAKVFDPEAPARLVRMEVPSIKPKDLRRYAHGVGIEMSPDLHRVANAMSGDDIQDVVDNAGSGSGLSIQMICTFSIQIIFLIAFILMFVFAISLNFIFWWLAFIRICLPIPRRS